MAKNQISVAMDMENRRKLMLIAAFENQTVSDLCMDILLKFINEYEKEHDIKNWKLS